jgi:hypothetical protein
MKATIFIKGIGMIYSEENEWKILFPFDDCHTVKYKTSESEDAVSLAAPGRTVRIRAAQPTSVFKVGARFDDFLDITSSVAHKDGIRLKAAGELPTVLLTIENAEFSVASHTFCRYQMLSSTQVLTHPREIAYSGKAEIDAGEITVETDDGEFQQTFNNDVIILFDNICLNPGDGTEPVSDMKLLYDVIEDASEPGKQFTIDRDPAQKPGALLVDPNFTGFGDLDNVAPGKEGLPCNVVKASNVKT